MFRNHGHIDDGGQQRAPANESPEERDTSEFLLRACHDLRTPLRAIRTNSELLARSGQTQGDSDFQQRLRFIIDSSRAIDRIVDGLSSYSIALQVDPGSFQPTSMDVMLRAVLARLDSELRARGAEVSYGALPRVSGNPDRLMQVFENLIRNALQNCGTSPPHIRVGAERAGETWLFTVEDNGPGVEPDYLETIFMPFQRLRATEGPGLGLAICREIIERHGGKIWAESGGAPGCRFLFTLPAN